MLVVSKHHDRNTKARFNVTPWHSNQDQQQKRDRYYRPGGTVPSIPGSPSRCRHVRTCKPYSSGKKCRLGTAHQNNLRSVGIAHST